MIKETAGFLLKYFHIAEKVEKEQLEICQYGMEIILATLVNIGSVLLIGFLCNEWMASIVFLTGFVAIRKQSGGYHAGSYVTCNLSLILCYSVLLLLYHTTVKDFDWIGLAVVFLIHFLVWYFFMPVENENKPLTSLQKRKAKKYGFYLSAAYTMMSALCIGMKFQAGLMLSYTVILVDMLALVSVVKRRIAILCRKKIR
ncbi:MAG: accessory gene regulator B family protein [Lachnospiraceae bacterium]|nr:accessory gene regulator B family protein [Lachnospiraceae bacterium]